MLKSEAVFCQTGAAARAVIFRAAALFIAGAPRGIRTLDLEIRSLLLYPAELWAHACWRMDDYSLWTRARRSWARILSNTVVASMALPSDTSSYPRIKLSRVSVSPKQICFARSIVSSVESESITTAASSYTRPNLLRINVYFISEQKPIATRSRQNNGRSPQGVKNASRERIR